MNWPKKIDILFLAREKKKLYFLFFLVIVMAIMEVVGIASVAPFVSIVSNPEVIHTNIYLSKIYSILELQDESQFQVYLGFFVLTLLILTNAFSAFVQWRIVRFTNEQVHNLSVRLMTAYMFQSYDFFIQRNTSELSSSILSEVNRAVGGAILPSMQVVARIVVIVFIFVLLIFVDPLVSIATLLVLGLGYWLFYLVFRSTLRELGSGLGAINSDRYKAVNEALKLIKEIRIKGKEGVFIDRFSLPSSRSVRYLSASSLISLIPRYFVESIAFGGVILTIVYAVANNSIDKTLPILSLYILAGYRLLPAIQQLYSNFTRLRFNIPSLNSLALNLKNIELSSNKAADSIRMRFSESIEILGVDYKYEQNDALVLKNVNFRIERNTTVGLIGGTGSGKTTLINILLGLIKPSGGEVKIDGIGLSERHIPSWQRMIGYISQDFHMLDDTILNNITLSDKEPDINRVREVVRMANIDSYINSLEQGLNTNIGENGVRLSGGQKQRLGIARALYENPELLIFDEATSALDSHTEELIMEAIYSLSGQKTIVIISHNTKILSRCDSVYALNDGIIKKQAITKF